MRYSYLFAPFITNVRNWSKPLKIPKEAIEDTRYKGYRSGRVSSNQNLKLTLNFSFTPSPGAPSVLSSLISARTNDTEKLGKKRANIRSKRSFF